MRKREQLLFDLHCYLLYWAHSKSVNLDYIYSYAHTIFVFTYTDVDMKVCLQCWKYTWLYPSGCMRNQTSWTSLVIVVSTYYCRAHSGLSKIKSIQSRERSVVILLLVCLQVQIFIDKLSSMHICCFVLRPHDHEPIDKATQYACLIAWSKQQKPTELFTHIP